MTRICLVCGMTFQNKRMGNFSRKVCSRKCANSLQLQSRLVRSLFCYRCHVCQKIFTLPKRVTTRLACSRECGNILAGSKRTGKHSEARKLAVRHGIKMSKLQHPEKWKRRSQEASQRLTLHNPFHQQSNLDKAKITKLNRGSLHRWMGIRGGNGQLTQPQIVLATALGWDQSKPTEFGCHPIYGKWLPEYSIKTGHNSLDGAGYPPCYKADIGCPTSKIVVEVDGIGHRLKMNINKDIKKEQKLLELGWTTLRFTNKEVMTNLSRVLLEIQNAIKDL